MTMDLLAYSLLLFCGAGDKLRILDILGKFSITERPLQPILLFHLFLYFI